MTVVPTLTHLRHYQSQDMHVRCQERCTTISDNSSTVSATTTTTTTTITPPGHSSSTTTTLPLNNNINNNYHYLQQASATIKDDGSVDDVDEELSAAAYVDGTNDGIVVSANSRKRHGVPTVRTCGDRQEWRWE